MNLVLVLISLPALLLAQANLAPATQANQILEDIRGVLADPAEPLTRGQEGRSDRSSPKRRLAKVRWAPSSPNRYGARQATS